MKRGNGVPLFLIDGGMELSWRYAWATLLTTLTFHQPIPSEKAPVERSLNDLKTPSESGWLPEIVEKYLGWGLGSLLGLAVFGVSCLILFYLFRWLFSRTSIRQKKQNPGLWYVISLWALRFQTFLVLCWEGIMDILKGYDKAAQLYSALLSWGRHSGLSCSPSETPTEYGLRLKVQFPSLRREIRWIIEAFNQEVYGEINLNSEQSAISRFAWRRLRSPYHWPSRLKAWFHHPTSLPKPSGRSLELID